MHDTNLAGAWLGRLASIISRDLTASKGYPFAYENAIFRNLHHSEQPSARKSDSKRLSSILLGCWILSLRSFSFAFASCTSAYLKFHVTSTCFKGRETQHPKNQELLPPEVWKAWSLKRKNTMKRNRNS